MTKEEKELLIKDLCARLPYGVMMKGVNDDFVLGINTPPTRLSYVLTSLDFKPYLRPMESMTEEEKKEFIKVLVKSQDCSYENNESATTIVNDWYLSKGFDVRGLIPKRLALEAPEDMYIIK